MEFADAGGVPVIHPFPESLMTYSRFPLRPIALAICLSTAAALAADPKAALSDFDGMDADHDSRVSAREHEAATQKMFRTLDANGDGKVTAAEMDAAHRKVTGKNPSEKEMSGAEKIKAIDIDGDGLLMAAEHAAGSRAMFEKMDTNRDGYLDRAEWTAGHAALMKKPK
jgi:EF hand domain-containing protein